jgi:hypothetical protein
MLERPIHNAQKLSHIPSSTTGQYSNPTPTHFIIMKSNIKLTVYLTTALMSEALAKGQGAIKPAGLAGIYDATFTRATLGRGKISSVNMECPLCDLNGRTLVSGNDSTGRLYCDSSDRDAALVHRPLALAV